MCVWSVALCLKGRGRWLGCVACCCLREAEPLRIVVWLGVWVLFVFSFCFGF